MSLLSSWWISTRCEVQQMASEANVEEMDGRGESLEKVEQRFRHWRAQAFATTPSSTTMHEARIHFPHRGAA